MYLQNKTIVLVGATGGIGSALAQELKKENVQLIFIAKEETELQRLNKDCGGSNRTYVCDLSDRLQINELIKRIIKEIPRIDILINSAGIGIYKPIAKLTADEWDLSISLNLTAPFLLTKGFLPLFQNSPGGLILNIGSGAGIFPMKNRSAYCSSKFGLRGLTLSLAKEYADTNIHFCLLSLGSTLTSFGSLSMEQKLEKQKLGKSYFTPQYVAKELVKIIKDDNRRIEYELYPGDYRRSF